MSLARPWLLLPPRWAHDLGPVALKFYGVLIERPTPAWRSFMWRGLVFKNRLGLAGGADKDAEGLAGWWSLGCGFVEVGTVTPKPQEPNEGVIVGRDLASRSLWNRMGFPSIGMDDVAANLRGLRPYRTPVFVNLGKNRHTPNEDASADYLQGLKAFRGLADAFVVNISSPNTKGLRDLQDAKALENLLLPLWFEAQKTGTPLLVKLSPDMEPAAFDAAVETVANVGLDGLVLTNTTLSRFEGSPYPTEGGVSGAPLAERSKAALKRAIQVLGPRREGKLVVSVGGIMSPDDVFERLAMGADLVQVYSAVVINGPGFFRTVARHEAVGAKRETVKAAP